MISVLSRHQAFGGGIDVAGAGEMQFNGKIYVSAGIGGWGKWGVWCFLKGGSPLAVLNKTLIMILF